MKDPDNHNSSTLMKQSRFAKKRPRPKRILLGQLNSFGDCLYATVIARQIKTDYPGCHLTWAIGSMFRSILDGNPYIDDIWEIPLTHIDEVTDVWHRFEQQVSDRKKSGDFDEVFLTQVAPGNLQNYDGTIRSSIMRAYGKPITVPLSPVVRLSTTEVNKVHSFMESHRLLDRSNVILFESSPKSGQSFLTQDFALEAARKLLLKVPNSHIILSSNVSFLSHDDRIIDGSCLSVRENAELTKYCSLLVGGSSGISWIATSDWAKPLPMIQLLKADAMWFASFIHDYEYWGLPTDTVLEMTECPVDKVVDCLTTVLTHGFLAARTKYHETIPMSFHGYHMIMSILLRRGRFFKALRLLSVNIRRHGLRRQLFLPPLPKLLRSRMQSLLKKEADIKKGN